MGVGRVILDGSILLDCEGENGVARLLPGAEYVLSKLLYSTISVGISYDSSMPVHKVALLKQVAQLYSCSSSVITEILTGDATNDGNISFGNTQDNGRVLYVVSSMKEDILHVLWQRGWMVGVLGEAEKDFLVEGRDLICIDQLEALPLAICQLNKKAAGSEALLVAFIMKPSREDEFAKRGAFPMSATENGLIFMPLTARLPLYAQLEKVDVILDKATDEIVSIESCLSSTFLNKITFTTGMLELERYMQGKLETCVIDPIKNIYPVLDRLWTQKILLGLEDLKFGSGSRIRGPRFLKVDNFGDAARKMVDAILPFPTIVKSQIACGVPEAHKMAMVFKCEDYDQLNVPVPAIVQEYVDHSSYIFKIYVLGKKIFYATRRSMPNADVLMNYYGRNRPLIFDSLKSFPVGNDHESTAAPCLDLNRATIAANWLQKKLDLTIFGFDVVIEEGSGDHVIVDVNYLPSFKEVPDNIAVPAFWEAIKTRYNTVRNKQQMPPCSP